VSAVLKDGKCDVAVLPPSGAIIPYRGETRLQGSWLRSNYRVGGKEGAEFVGHYTSAASGEYRLVYQPKEIGPVTIDPRTGAVTK
jgi:hypothetical protein